MSDFASLLRKPAGQGKKPPVLDVGNYPGVVKSFEVGDKNKNKTPYVRFHLQPTGWPDGASPQVHEDGTPIDLTKRQMRRDYFLTDDAVYRLDEFLRSCGIDLTGRGYDECLPEANGKAVVIEVKQYMNQTSNEPGNEVGSVVGTEG